MLRVSELLEFEPKGKKNRSGGSFKIRNQRYQEKAIIFILSDFIADDYQRTLKIISNKHDVTGIRIYDARKRKSPI